LITHKGVSVIYSNLTRQFLLGATGTIFLIFALWAMARPSLLASALGYTIERPNGLSEFHAIYVGVFLAQALLCVVAMNRVQEAVFGDLVAVFLLAQPVGRCVACFRKGYPSGFILFLLLLELIAGSALLLIRPEVCVE